MTNDKTKWKQVVYKIGFWLTAEIWLNLIGLDNIADYSEFIFDRDLELAEKNCRTVKVTEYPPQFCPQIADFCPIPGTSTEPQKIAANGQINQAKVFKNKCQQLTEPCVKVRCMATKKVTKSATMNG